MRNLITITLVVIVFALISCADDFLDVNRDKKVVIPRTIEDYQSLLDFVTVMNTNAGFLLGEISSDDYYLRPERWAQIPTVTDKNGYIWEPELYQGEESYDWNRSYSRVLYANTVLEGLETLDNKSDEMGRNVKGTALFHRSYAFYLLSALFSDVYRKESAATELGIPLKVGTDITVHVPRATIQETYDKIVGDLKLAVSLLPERTDLKIRPNKAAAYSLLARCFLQMDDFANAFLYSDSAFVTSDGLLNYNDINMSPTFPFPRYNKEVIFADVNANSIAISSSYLNVDTNLYGSYDEADLRKDGFFYDYAGNKAFRGSYDGSSRFFIGLTTGEMLLIRAEASLRLGNDSKASEDLNTLLQHRYKTGQFERVDLTDHADLLSKILLEKRKETVFRGVRWTELKRLNKDPKTNTILKRVINNDRYELKPNDNRYIMPIPDNAINLGGIQQNER